VYFFPKTILAQAESTVPPAASLRHSRTQFVVVSLWCVSLHDDMKFIAAFFFSLKPLVQSSKKKSNKKRSHYSVIGQNTLSDNLWKIL